MNFSYYSEALGNANSTTPLLYEFQDYCAGVIEDVSEACREPDVIGEFSVEQVGTFFGMTDKQALHKTLMPLMERRIPAVDIHITCQKWTFMKQFDTVN